ncbi:MAG: hypothetical protein FJX67_08750 [Alphaproteobacteria bacterium]|nr:hypothetical protein [Alphaproteobacteria bacterium]
MNGRRFAAVAVVVVSGTLAACGSREPPRPCPEVLIPRDLGAQVKFRPGPGRDATDVEHEARIIDFQGNCTFAWSGPATVTINVSVEVRRGPAATAPVTDVVYFAAIPRYFPNEAGKRSFPLRVEFRNNNTRVVLQEEVRLNLPLGPREPTEDYVIYLGLQLTPDEVEFNRRRFRG